jgi:hypothetical protein
MRSSLTPPSPAAEPILAALGALIEAGAIVELRVLKTSKGTVSGYFTDHDKLTEEAAAWSGKAPAVYITLNPVKPELLARAVNRIVQYAKSATADNDIVKRVWVLIDFDPVRPTGISSTDTEHDAALSRARECREWLIDQGVPANAIIVADSGNGAHLLIRVDLPNDATSRNLVERCLKALDLRFSDGVVGVDLTTFNAARICKLYGTLACKGDSTPDRPHRIARILDVPDAVVGVPREVLEKLAAMAPATPKKSSCSKEFDLATWIAEHKLPVVTDGLWSDKGHKWILNPCPWNADHTNRAAYIVQHGNGAIAAGCHHNGCADKDWHALRDEVEPEWRGGRSQDAQQGGSDHHVILTPATSFSPEPVRHAWEGRVPLGMVTLLVGVPGQGKSQLTIQLLARASRGDLPGDLFGQPVTVALATAEDAISQVVVPRLMAAGADLDRVRIIQVKHEGSTGGLSLPEDIDQLREQLIAAGARMVVVDPLVAHITGGINTWKDQDVRRVLAPLGHLAEEANAAVVGVMHLNKSQTSDVLNKVGGSVGFGAAARSVLFFAPDPENPDPDSYKRILAHAKCNVSPLAPALRFRVAGEEIEGAKGESIKTSVIVWCGEARGVSASDLVAEPATAEDRRARTAKEQAVEEAQEVIRQLLAGGTKDAESVQRELKRLGIKERDWRAAKALLGVRSQKAGFSSGWDWVLPEDRPRTPYNAQSSIFGEEKKIHTAKSLKCTEGDEDDEGGQTGEEGHEDGPVQPDRAKGTKTDEGDEEDEDRGDGGRGVPLQNGLDHDEAYWQRHDCKVIDAIRQSARSGGVS